MTKPHGNTGRRNAAKDTKAESLIQVRCTAEHKARILGALKDDERLSQFVLSACEVELKKREA